MLVPYLFSLLEPHVTYTKLFHLNQLKLCYIIFLEDFVDVDLIVIGKINYFKFIYYIGNIYNYKTIGKMYNQYTYLHLFTFELKNTEIHFTTFFTFNY